MRAIPAGASSSALQGIWPPVRPWGTQVDNYCITLWVVLICRSVLAEAVFKELVSMSPLNSFVSVDSASIGPAVGKASHDPRVMWAAQKAGLNLSRRNTRPFDEQVDIVNYDLVLTMDHFDHDEVSSSRIMLI